MSNFTVVMAQMNPLVGDIPGNTDKVIQWVEQAVQTSQASVLVFPELTLTGYPPEDLLLRSSLEVRINRALEALCTKLPADVAVVVGYPKRTSEGLYNVAGVIFEGRIQYEYAKQHLPNYLVFDEARYFIPGNQMSTFEFMGCRMALTVCEDIWFEQTSLQAKEANAELLINLNASPFHLNKQREREEVLTSRALTAGIPIIYVNQVGGQDELVFDGGSLAVNPENSGIACRAPMFDEALTRVDIERTVNDGIERVRCAQKDCALVPGGIEATYRALVLGVRDYVNKNGFKSAVLGLSGGIDSALTLAIAADALGVDRVEAVMMPFRYTSQMSKDDAAEQARRMGVKYHTLGIEGIYESFMDTLSPLFAEADVDKTEENIQARSRGVLLMAISNKKGSIVLTTGNKSEMAVGYATLYGDMVGGYAVLKDVPKVTVFELAKYRNTLSPIIPDNVITRPPSAELAPGQIDEDSLPPYHILDQILGLYIEQDLSAEAIIEKGFDRDEVMRVLRLVDVNEYKRRQAAVGVRISQRGFGRDRRYPITNGWIIGD